MSSRERESLAASYRHEGDEELLDRWTSGQLTDLAAEVMRAEFGARGIEPPPLATGHAATADEPAPPYEVVATYAAGTEAHIMKGRLAAAGLDPVLADANLSQTYDLIQIAVGGVKLKVPCSQAAEARAILRAIAAGDLAIGDDEVDSTAG
jgi:hypothetical protein